MGALFLRPSLSLSFLTNPPAGAVFSLNTQTLSMSVYTVRMSHVLSRRRIKESRLAFSARAVAIRFVEAPDRSEQEAAPLTAFLEASPEKRLGTSRHSPSKAHRMIQLATGPAPSVTYFLGGTSIPTLSHNTPFNTTMTPPAYHPTECLADGYSNRLAQAGMHSSSCTICSWAPPCALITYISARSRPANGLKFSPSSV